MEILACLSLIIPLSIVVVMSKPKFEAVETAKKHIAKRKEKKEHVYSSVRYTKYM